ncbi:MAG: hypothetical protein A2Y41_14210 [Spirochaetes bacterium GWB1_36_13]|nr:MAG: hypothetical protein A2Y41_14210 [Spirochaetes bacterium GWB1_36_13]
MKQKMRVYLFLTGISFVFLFLIGCKSKSTDTAPVVPVTTLTIESVNIQANATVGGVIKIEATVPSTSTVEKVEFYVDGTKIGEDDIKINNIFAYTWDTMTVSDAQHTLILKSIDAQGKSESKSIGITVYNPSVITSEIVYPVDQFVVNGQVNLSAKITANKTISKVEFYINNTLLGEKTTATGNIYNYEWNTTSGSYPDAFYTVRTIATDSSGSTKVSSSYVKVSNAVGTTAITFSALTPAADQTFNSSVYANNTPMPISVTASGPSAMVIQCLIDGTLKEAGSVVSGGTYTYNWEDAYKAAHGMHVITLRAYDISDPNNVKTENIFLTINDDVAPIVSLYSPAAGSTISGNIVASSLVTDNIENDITRIKLYMMAPGTTTWVDKGDAIYAPFQWEVKTTDYPNGDYHVKLVAYDKQNNQGVYDTTNLSIAPTSRPITISN